MTSADVRAVAEARRPGARRRRLFSLGIAWWVSGCWFADAALAFQPGPTTPSRAVDQINASSMRGLPSVAPREVVRPDMVWVPGRWAPVPGEPGGVFVPGHWEQRISDREFYVPPVTVVKPSTGTLETIPAGVRVPAEQRVGP